MDNKNFVITKDIDTANYFTKLGLQCVGSNNGVFTFVNNKSITMKFDEKELHFCYSNIMKF